MNTRDGGPGGIRTLDLSDANRTLSQLSYRPKCIKNYITFCFACQYQRLIFFVIAHPGKIILAKFRKKWYIGSNTLFILFIFKN